MAEVNRISLLIREVNPATKDGRLLRENLTRIENFLNGNKDGTLVQGGGSTTVNVNAANSDISNADVYETQVCTSNGQTVFSLSLPPYSSAKVRISINGEEIGNGVYFTVSGSTVTFNAIAAGFALELINEFGIPDQIIFQYTKA